MYATNVTGSYETPSSILDSHGTAANVMQVSFDPGITGSVQVLGRVSPDVQWLPMGAPITSDAFLPTLPVPLIRCDVTVASGGGGSNKIRVRSRL